MIEGSTKAVDFTCSTDGGGYWSQRVAPVKCTKLEITYVAAYDEDDGPAQAWQPNFGELQVSFDPLSWNPEDHGLIYTDDLFEAELRAELVKLGFSQDAANDVSYSEQGMQGQDFVSFDIGGKFLAEVKAVFA